MSTADTVLDIDWFHRDGTRIHATIKIGHTYNRKEDILPVLDSFCEDLLASLLIQQEES